MAAHRYWRLYIIDTQAGVGGLYTGCAKLEMRAVAGGPSVCSGGSPFASTTYGDYYSSKAFDTDPNTRWSSDVNGYVNSYLGYDFGGNPQAIVEIAFTCANDASYQNSAKNFRVEYSDDGTNYIAWWQSVFSSWTALNQTKVSTRPTSNTRPLLTDDANTVSHLWVQDGVLLDTKGHSWTEVGFVPRMGKMDIGLGTGLQAEGLGPFSSTARFESTATSDATCFNVTNQFAMTVIFSVPSTTFSSNLFAHATNGGLSQGNGLEFGIVSGAAFVDTTTNAFIATESGVAVGTHVVSMGRRAGASYGQSKRDLAAQTWNSGNGTFNMSQVTQSVKAILGGRQMTGWPYFVPFPGIFYEMLFTTTDSGAYPMDSIHNSLMDAATVAIINSAASTAQTDGLQQGLTQGIQQGFDSKVSKRRFFGHFDNH
jgi:hypothetical protein